MPKHMNNRYILTMDLQLFAGEGDGGEAGDDAGDGDDQDDDESDEGGDGGPKYTQEDLDKAIARTIARERRKAEKAGADYSGKKKGSEKDGDGGESENERKVKEAEDRASRAEAKNACYEAGVTKDSVDDVVALARSYMAADEDLDLEEAIEKVVKKYPQFKKDTADPKEEEDGTKGKSWGQRQTGRGARKLSGVEEHFYELNPDLRK